MKINRLGGNLSKKRSRRFIWFLPKRTYLLWIDCREITEDSEKLAAFLRKETGLNLSSGIQYGKTGEGFLRMNIACPRAVLKDGLQRLKDGITLYIYT